MKKRIALACAILTAGFVFAACESNAKPAPMKENLIGFWTLQPDSYPSVRSHVKIDPKTATLDFRPDGKLIAVNFPFEDIDKFGVNSGTGWWEFPTNLAGEVTLTLGHHGYSLVFKRDATGALWLFHAVGDPDSTERWVWKKTVRVS